MNRLCVCGNAHLISLLQSCSLDPLMCAQNEDQLANGHVLLWTISGERNIKGTKVDQSNILLTADMFFKYSIRICLTLHLL